MKKISENILKILKQIGEIADEEDLSVYLVGGFVRDLYLNRESKDIDLVVISEKSTIPKLGVKFAKIIAQKIKNTSEINYFENFGTAQFKINGIEFEIIGARKESYDRNSRKPIVEDGTLLDDQLRRDFTINDMYLSLNSKSFLNLIDLFNGKKDIEDKILKTPINPLKTFDDDPLRILRAIRFATILDFTIEENVKNAIVKKANRLEIISGERIIVELNKILKSNNSHKGFQLMIDLGILKVILPEIYALKGKEEKNGVWHKDNLYHTIKVLSNWDNIKEEYAEKLSCDVIYAKWAALLHDTGKVETKKFDEENKKWTFYNHQKYSEKIVEKVFRRLSLPLDHRFKYTKFLVAEHERIKISSNFSNDAAIRRIILLSKDWLWDIYLFGIYDTSSSHEERVSLIEEKYLRLYEKSLDVMERDNLRNFQPPIDGEEIMEIFDLKPSKEVGDLKAALKEAIIEGEVENDYDKAKEFLYNLKSEKI